MFNCINQLLFTLSQKILFQIDPELAHNIVLQSISTAPELCLNLLGRIDLKDFKNCDPNNNNNGNGNDKYAIDLGELHFPFPVGLAAGLDKNATAYRYFSQVGFGGVEVGTVTPLAQVGNERPRMFRLKKERSLRNKMGFNNNGMFELKQKISAYSYRNHLVPSGIPFSVPLGINLGKNKLTSLKKCHQDYQKLYKMFARLADYLVINVSSPNTPNLRKFEGVEGLKQILESLNELRVLTACPLFVKISPDLALDSLEDLVHVANDYNINGFISTNTTTDHCFQDGGVSGKLLKSKSMIVRKRMLDILKEFPQMDLIGVGGIESFDDLFKFWKDGGKMTQVFTSFIYQGPKLLFDIKNNIDQYLSKYQFSNVSELLKNINSVKKL